MDDTATLRKRMLLLWNQFDNGKVSVTDARVHIGFARTVLETLKVEIAAAHLQQLTVPAVPLGDKQKRLPA